MFKVKAWEQPERSVVIDKLRVGMKFKKDGYTRILAIIGAEGINAIMALIDIDSGIRYTDGVVVKYATNISRDEAQRIFNNNMKEFKYVKPEV